MQSGGPCDCRGFALVNSGGKRDWWRIFDFKPGGLGGYPALNRCRGEFVRKFGRHNSGNNHSLEEPGEDADVSDQDQVVDWASVCAARSRSKSAIV